MPARAQHSTAGENSPPRTLLLPLHAGDEQELTCLRSIPRWARGREGHWESRYPATIYGRNTHTDRKTEGWEVLGKEQL